MKKNLILEEIDEENGVEYFAQNFRDAVGMPFAKWKQKAKLSRDGGVTTWKLGDVMVVLDPDDAFYKVYELSDEDLG